MDKFFKYKNENKYIATNPDGGYLSFTEYKGAYDMSVGIDKGLCEHVCVTCDPITKTDFFNHMDCNYNRLLTAIGMFKIGSSDEQAKQRHQEYLHQKSKAYHR
jgi:hypothetical protein